MKTKWNTTKLIAAASLGVLLLVLNLPGAGLNAVTGSATIGGTLNSLVYAAMIIICSSVVEQFGAATIMFTIFGFLAIPFQMFGPPGFLPKVLSLISGGLLSDVLYLLLKRNKLVASIVVGGPVLYYWFVFNVWLAQQFGIPGIEFSAKLLFTLVGIGSSLILGAIGGILGWFIYSRIKDAAVVVRIQGA